MTGFPKCGAVVKASRSISTEQLRQTIMGLCAFPTRHTLSGARGVDAAADWLVRRLQSFGGNLRVDFVLLTTVPKSKIELEFILLDQNNNELAVAEAHIK